MTGLIHNSARLRVVTDHAIAEKQKQEADKIAAKQAEDKLIAESILATVENACLAEAKQGKSRATVMLLVPERDYKYPDLHEVTLSPRRLIGPALIVWNSLSEAGINANVEYWESSSGVKTGFCIVAHW